MLGLADNTRTNSDAYQRAVLERIDDVDFEWAPLRLEASGHTLDLLVSADALQLDGVRLNATARFADQLADAFGALLVTPLISDEIWLQADDRLAPQTQPWANTIAAMVRHSREVDAQRSGGRLVAPVGKDWALTPTATVNYGWQLADGSRIQGPYAGHGIDFADYSQVVRLVSREAYLDGKPVDLADIYVDPDLAHLVSYAGPLPTVDPFVGTGSQNVPANPARPLGGGSQGANVAAGALALTLALLLARALARRSAA